MQFFIKLFAKDLSLRAHNERVGDHPPGCCYQALDGRQRKQDDDQAALRTSCWSAKKIIELQEKNNDLLKVNSDLQAKNAKDKKKFANTMEQMQKDFNITEQSLEQNSRRETGTGQLFWASRAAAPGLVEGHETSSQFKREEIIKLKRSIAELKKEKDAMEKARDSQPPTREDLKESMSSLSKDIVATMLQRPNLTRRTSMPIQAADQTVRKS